MFNIGYLKGVQTDQKPALETLKQSVSIFILTRCKSSGAPAKKMSATNVNANKNL